MAQVGYSYRIFIIIAITLQLLAGIILIESFAPQMLAGIMLRPPVGESLPGHPPARNRISSLPGQPDVSFKQYSGYITVDESHGRRLFYYFVEAVNPSATTPLVLWFNGGPGCSSLVGAFSELGPFRPNASGNGLTVNDASWNQVAHVIFLESPAGVGFSYSNNPSDITTNDEKTAKDSLAFLLGWLLEYPEYNSTKFYITGESYAGHYVPQLATLILNNNKVSGQAQINLQGIMIGNPAFDEMIDRSYAFLEYVWGHGMISEATHDAFTQDCNWASLSQSPACQKVVQAAHAEMGSGSQFFNKYNVFVDACQEGGEQAHRLKVRNTWPAVEPCLLKKMAKYLSLREVETSLHTEKSGWALCGKINYSVSDHAIKMAPIVANLVNAGLIRVWIYSGDADTVIPLVGTRMIVSGIAKSMNLKVVAKYQPWYHDGQIGGWFTSWGSLVYATVRGAGHMVPMYQPASSLQLFTAFLDPFTIGPPTNDFPLQKSYVTLELPDDEKIGEKIDIWKAFLSKIPLNSPKSK